MQDSFTRFDKRFFFLVFLVFFDFPESSGVTLFGSNPGLFNDTLGIRSKMPMSLELLNPRAVTNLGSDVF